MASRSLPIVKIVWVDAHSHGMGWMDKEEFDEWLDEPGVMVSFGILLHKGRKWLAIGMSVGPDAVADCLKIPIGMVKRVQRLGTISEKDIGYDKHGGKRCHKSSAPISSLLDRWSLSMSEASRSPSVCVRSRSARAKQRRSATRCSVRMATR